MRVEDLSNCGGSRQLADALAVTGHTELYPPQALAVKAGLLAEKSSFVIAAPTASGKTLIAEMAALQAILEQGGKVVYLVPLRALAREKFEDLLRKYKDKIKVAQSTGDFDSADPWLYTTDLIISTNEKMDSLIRHRASWLREVKLVIADEIHLIGEPHRGPTLEVVLTRLRWINPELRIIALSATIPNATDIAHWLHARLVESDWRPVPLREGVFFDDAIVFAEGSVRAISRESSIEALNLAIDTIKDKGQAIIFVNTRKSSESVAHKATLLVSQALSGQEKEFLKTLSRDILEASPEPTRICKSLAECIGDGVAFHHAGINSSQRRIIEDSFKANKIKLLAATTTLAMGLNLPSRRVIIRDWWRYESGLGIQPIPAMEIKQMSGRAGRPGFDTYGEAILIAKNKSDEEYLLKIYIKGKPEDIESHLANETVLRTHILSSVSGSFTGNRYELMDFLKKTYFAHRRGIEYLSSITDTILDFLIREEMVVSKDSLAATRFGRRISELYIDPFTGVILRDALHQLKEKHIFPLLHLIARTPDMISLPLRKKDYDEMIQVFAAHADELLIPEEEKYPSEKILSELKIASVLMEWIEEEHEDTIVTRFNIGPGDLHTLIDITEWLLYSASEISKVFKLREEEMLLSLLRVRVSYGIKEELLQLVTLKGVGRIRARNLYNSGYKTLKDIKKASIGELTKVSSIGKVIAEGIKGQV